MTEPTDLGSRLEQLAENMILAAEDAKVTVAEKLKVFEAVSQHYVNMQKVNGKKRPDGAEKPGGKTMAGLASSINDEEETDDE